MSKFEFTLLSIAIAWVTLAVVFGIKGAVENHKRKQEEMKKAKKRRKKDNSDIFSREDHNECIQIIDTLRHEADFLRMTLITSMSERYAYGRSVDAMEDGAEMLEKLLKIIEKR